MKRPKYKKTYKFAFTSAILLSLATISVLLFTHFFLDEVYFSFRFFFVFGVLVFLVSFIIIQYRVEKFIYLKLKKMHEEFSILDSSKLDKNIITSDIEVISKNMKSFAESKTLEIALLKEREVYRREFLGNISHELKTPLFTVQGYILTLLEGAVNNKEIRLKYLERANNGVERLNHIVKDLDMISKLETKGLKIKYIQFNIISLIEEVFNLLEMEAEKRNITLSFDKVYEFPIIVNADKDRIEQVLLNLIINSIYYGKKNGSTTISVRFYNNTKTIISVIDDGNGIPEKVLPRLFERFYRVDGSRSRNKGGSGLGLSIVKHIMEAHKQEVFVKSELTKGSVFSFTLESVN